MMKTWSKFLDVSIKRNLKLIVVLQGVMCVAQLLLFLGLLLVSKLPVIEAFQLLKKNICQ